MNAAGDWRTGRVLCLVLALVALYGIFATVFVALSSLGVGAVSAGLLAGLGAGGMAAILAPGRDFITRAARRLAQRSETVDLRAWLAGCILAGLVVRAGWLALFPPVQQSDMQAYHELAVGLVEQGHYAIGGTRAFWPPGLPFLLAGFVAAFGNGPYVPAIFQACVFAGVVVVTALLARRIAGPRAARVAAAILVVWPGYTATAGLAKKEPLLMLLLTGAALLYLGIESVGPGRRRAAIAASGALLGYGVLTHPATLLIAAAFPAFEVARGRVTAAAAGRLALLFGAAALVVLPWTVRNHRVLGAFVPVSTTGGIVLYVGNNPRATGGFVKIAHELTSEGEVARDREARARALSWIRTNPGAFLALAVRKQILFLGDDANGIYESLRRGLGIEAGPYPVIKGLANAFWILVLALVVIAMLGAARAPDGPPGGAGLLILMFLVTFGIHTVFESEGRFHMSLMAFLAILAASDLDEARPPAAP